MLLYASSLEVSKSKLAALWRRLTGTSKKSKEKEEKSKKKPERFCTYAGVSDDFKRIQKGREIAIVICGSQKVGKSSFVRFSFYGIKPIIADE